MIVDNNLKPMKKWSSRRSLNQDFQSSQTSKMINEIRNILNILSGNDIIEMLKSKKYFYLVYI